MYLTALITKWRSKNIQFVIDFPEEGNIRITAHLLGQQRYCMVISDNIEYGCKVIDLGLTRRMEEGKVDNNNTDSGKK